MSEVGATEMGVDMASVAAAPKTEAAQTGVAQVDVSKSEPVVAVVDEKAADNPPVVPEPVAVELSADDKAAADARSTVYKEELEAAAKDSGKTLDEVANERLADSLKKLKVEAGRDDEATVEAEKAKIDPTVFLEAKALGRGEESSEEDVDVPEEAQTSAYYTDYLAELKTKAVEAGQDPNSKDLQRIALDRYYYLTAADEITRDPHALERIKRDPEKNPAYMLAEKELYKLVQLRRDQGKPELTKDEEDRWKLALFQEMWDKKKIKGAIAEILAQVAVSLGLSLTKTTVTESTEDVLGNGQRR